MSNNINWKLYKAYKDKGFTAKSLAQKANIEYFRFTRLINGKLQKWRPVEMRTLSQILRTPQKDLF